MAEPPILGPVPARSCLPVRCWREFTVAGNAVIPTQVDDGGNTGRGDPSMTVPSPTAPSERARGATLPGVNHAADPLLDGRAARRLEVELRALRLSKDELVTALYGEQNPAPAPYAIEERVIDLGLRAWSWEATWSSASASGVAPPVRSWRTPPARRRRCRPYGAPPRSRRRRHPRPRVRPRRARGARRCPP